MRPRIIAFMNSYSHGKSGGDMVFIEIAKRLSGFDKIIVTSSLGKKLCQESTLQGEYFITTDEPEFRNVILTYIKRTIKALFLKLPVRQNDIFLGTSDFFPDVLPIFFLKLKNRNNKWIQHIFHIIPQERKWPSLLQKVSLFFIKQAADIIIVDNNLLKQELTNKGFGPKKITVNHPGIDHNYLKNVKKTSKDHYDGVFMAQLRPSKGIVDLIEIWKLVCKQLPMARLGIIGKGKKEIVEQLSARISKMNLDKNIDFIGFRNDDEAFSIIKSGKIFVFPSHEEGFGIAALQAQALGIPVAAWNLPVFTEIFSQGMIKVKMGKIEKFADAAVTLLTKSPTYRRLSKDAIDNARRFDWEQTARRELALLER